MSATVAPSAVTTFLELALSGEQRQAVRLATDLLDSGVPTATVITDLLAAVQREIGERWHRAEASTADEHLVTGVSQAALDALSSASAQIEPDGLVVVACAESDWHSLPAQMFAELLRAHGQGVLFLGPSTPAQDVAAFIQRRRPDALAITCNLPLSYIGCARLADVAHADGLPVIAGGRALTAARAATLGADAWTPGAGDAAATLRAWRGQAPVVSPHPVQLDQLALRLDAEATALGDAAMHGLEARFASMADYDARQRARSQEDLVYIVRFIAAARLVDDDEVFTSFERWLAALLAARGVPEHALAAGLEALAPLLRDVDRTADRLAVAALARED